METSFFSNNYKKYILLFPLGILIGSVLMNLAGINKINEWGLFNREIELSCSFASIMKYVIKERVGNLILIFLICFSTLKDKLILVLTGWLGLMMGLMQSVFVIQYGFLGVISYVFLIGFHCVVYFFATMGLLVISERRESVTFSSSIIFVLISYIIGLVVEIFMSWWGVAWAMRLLN